MSLKKYLQLKSQFEFECQRHNMTLHQLDDLIENNAKLNETILKLRAELSKEKLKNSVSCPKVQITLDEFIEIMLGCDFDQKTEMFQVSSEKIRKLTEKLFGDLKR